MLNIEIQKKETEEEKFVISVKSFMRNTYPKNELYVKFTRAVFTNKCSDDFKSLIFSNQVSALGKICNNSMHLFNLSMPEKTTASTEKSKERETIVNARPSKKNENDSKIALEKPPLIGTMKKNKVLSDTSAKLKSKTATELLSQSKKSILNSKRETILNVNKSTKDTTIEKKKEVDISRDQKKQIQEKGTNAPKEDALKKEESLKRRVTKLKEKELKNNEREKKEQEEQEKIKREQIEREEKEKIEKEKRENEKKEKEEQERIEREKKEKKKQEERERIEMEKKEKEERERVEKEKREKEERERKEREQKERIEREKKEQEERERAEKEEQERIEREKREREQKERVERERMEREEKERVEREKREKEERERVEKEKREKEERERMERKRKKRIEREQKKKKKEKENIEREKREQEENMQGKVMKPVATSSIIENEDENGGKATPIMTPINPPFREIRTKNAAELFAESSSNDAAKATRGELPHTTTEHSGKSSDVETANESNATTDPENKFSKNINIGEFSELSQNCEEFAKSKDGIERKTMRSFINSSEQVQAVSKSGTNTANVRENCSAVADTAHSTNCTSLKPHTPVIDMTKEHQRESDAKSTSSQNESKVELTETSALPRTSFTSEQPDNQQSNVQVSPKRAGSVFKTSRQYRRSTVHKIHKVIDDEHSLQAQIDTAPNSSIDADQALIYAEKESTPPHPKQSSFVQKQSEKTMKLDDETHDRENRFVDNERNVSSDNASTKDQQNEINTTVLGDVESMRTPAQIKRRSKASAQHKKSVVNEEIVQTASQSKKQRRSSGNKKIEERKEKELIKTTPNNPLAEAEKRQSEILVLNRSDREEHQPSKENQSKSNKQVSEKHRKYSVSAIGSDHTSKEVVRIDTGSEEKEIKATPVLEPVTGTIAKKSEAYSVLKLDLNEGKDVASVEKNATKNGAVNVRERVKGNTDEKQNIERGETAKKEEEKENTEIPSGKDEHEEGEQRKKENQKNDENMMTTANPSKKVKPKKNKKNKTTNEENGGKKNTENKEKENLQQTRENVTNNLDKERSKNEKDVDQNKDQTKTTKNGKKGERKDDKYKMNEALNTASIRVEQISQQKAQKRKLPRAVKAENKKSQDKEDLLSAKKICTEQSIKNSRDNQHKKDNASHGHQEKENTSLVREKENVPPPINNERQKTEGVDITKADDNEKVSVAPSTVKMSSNSIKRMADLPVQQSPSKSSRPSLFKKVESVYLLHSTMLLQPRQNSSLEKGDDGIFSFRQLVKSQASEGKQKGHSEMATLKRPRCFKVQENDLQFASLICAKKIKK